MENDFCHDILKAEGFKPLAEINHDFDITLWWHPDIHQELSLVYLNGWVLLRTVKHYRLTAMGKDGELYARDLGALDSYLTTHFDEVHFWSSSFRDITPNMASRIIKEKNFRYIANQETIDTSEMTKHLQQISEQISVTQTALQRDEGLLRLNHGKTGLLQDYVRNQIFEKRRHLEKLRAQKKMLSQQLAVQKHLENQYMHKGEATCLLFACCSNIQIAREKEDFADATHSIVKELQDIHKYQIQQKLQGGKLQIYIDEVDSPAISLLTRWVGAVLNPRQLAKLGPEFADLYKAVEEQLMVFPRKDILLGGSVQDEKKLVGTRVVRNFLKKLEAVPTAPTKSRQSPESDMAVWIGNVRDGASKIGNPWKLPLDKVGHTYISGSTGSGKSYLARAIVEGCAVYKNLSIVILDPHNQWVGLLCPEDRPEILERYEAFGLKPEDARSFGFDYHFLAQGFGKPLPSDLREIAYGRHIVSFKGLDDLSKYSSSADMLYAILEGRMHSESKRTETVVLMEEVPNFMKRTTSGKLRAAAERVESAIEQTAREGRKYGISLIIISQTLRDFSYGVAVVRQNMSTRVFMHNSDREIDYASEYLDDGKAIVKLRPGEAFICNPEWGVARVSVRPPLSKVWEPTDEETKRLVGSVSKTQPTLSREAKAVLNVAYERYHQTGEPIKLAFIAEQLGITSRRKIGRIINELKKASAVKFERLDKQGKPLVIVPIGVQKPYINRT